VSSASEIGIVPGSAGTMPVPREPTVAVS
jgi:hypothetical protein